MRQSRIFPPLSEEYVDCIVLIKVKDDIIVK